MGALGEAVARATLEKLGRAGWQRKMAAVEQFWTKIERAIDALDLSFERVRLYQDGLPVCGREAELVQELARAGSRNHQLLLRLMEKGATLMGTESADLLLEEYRLARDSLRTRPPRSLGVAARRRSATDAVLERRDRFMAQRLQDTLKPGETGLLFVGMLHAVDRYLDRDLEVLFPFPRPH